jgi:hypothetical protein
MISARADAVPIKNANTAPNSARWDRETPQSIAMATSGFQNAWRPGPKKRGVAACENQSETGSEVSDTLAKLTGSGRDQNREARTSRPLGLNP